MADINIYGTLHAATGDGVLARAEQIEDTDSGKKQSEINADVAEQLDAVQAMAHSTASHFYHLGTLADEATILSRAAQYAVVSDPNVTFITALYPSGDVLQSIVIQQQVTKSRDGSGVCMQYVFKDKARWTRYVNFNAAGSVTGTQSLQSDVPRNLNLTANGGLSLRGLWGGVVGSGVTLPNKNDLREGTATASTVPLVLTKSVKDTATCELQPATTARAGVMTVEQVNQLSDAKADAKEAIAALQNTPTVANSSTESDLDISDENGNVLARFSEGHIKTKNFDSSKINTDTENNEYYSIIKVIFERGSIGDNGNFDKSNTFVFDGFLRTGKYISVGASPKIKTDTPCIIFGYDSSFRCVIKLDIPKNVDFVNLSLSSSVAYIKIKVKSSTYPNVYLRGAKKYVFNTAESGCQTALFEVQENVSGNITNENSKEQLIPNDILYGGCIFSLPYNYSPNGTPSRLIIFCHETPDRVWGMQNYNNPANTTYNGTSYNLQYTYDKIIDWLNKEGFAVFDVYGSSSKYNFDRGSMANADNVNCMVSGYNWFVNNYNIAKDGVCVTGKSIGGLMSMRITMGIGIPVICSGLMVPSLCAVKRLFVYEDSTVKAYCEDMNFDDVESNGTTLTWDTLKRGTNEQRKTYLLSNFDKWCLYDPWTCGINRQDKKAIVDNIVDASGNPSKWENDVFMSRHEYRVPLKIWSAVDDETQVSHYEHMSMVNSIRNMGGYAEIRTMPNGSGGHYSTDRSPLATRMNIVTKLGYECTDIPLAWVELINFFRSFIGINI